MRKYKAALKQAVHKSTTWVIITLLSQGGGGGSSWNKKKENIHEQNISPSLVKTVHESRITNRYLEPRCVTGDMLLQPQKHKSCKSLFAKVILNHF